MVFAPTEDDMGDFLAKLVEVLVSLRFAFFFVKDVELAVEAEEWSEDRWVEEFDNGVEFVDAVFDGGACEDEGVSGVETFDGASGFGGPIFDALGFVENDDVGLESVVDV